MRMQEDSISCFREVFVLQHFLTQSQLGDCYRFGAIIADSDVPTGSRFEDM